MAKSTKTIVEKEYALRNESDKVFQIRAEVTKKHKSGVKGAQITAKIEHEGVEGFTYLVEFGGEFTKTKENFTPTMYLHTAVSIVESQIESKRYEDCWLHVHRDSGLTEVKPLAEKT